VTDSRVSRGRKSEDLLADDCRAIWPDVEAVPAGLPGVDLRNTPGIAFEVKSRRRFNPMEWARQAGRNTPEGEIPLVVVRMTGQGPASIGEWLAFTPWKYQKRLIEEAGYGTAMGGGNPPENTQAHQPWPGPGVERLHELGCALSEAASAAIFRRLETHRW
jgi:hypothetical protein